MNRNFNRNLISSERRAVSVTEQKPKQYWTLWDDHPEYVQVQRTQGVINTSDSISTIKWNIDSFDPNTFLKSKAYIKLDVQIRKMERETDSGGVLIEDIGSNYALEDRIYYKPGLVLHNACTSAKLKMNSHEIEYRDLRYIQKKLNMSFAGRNINDSYLTNSGMGWENYNGIYNSQGNLKQTDGERISFDLVDLGFISGPGNNVIRFISDTNIITNSNTRGFNATAPGENNVSWSSVTRILTFNAGTGTAIDITNLLSLGFINPLRVGDILTLTNVGISPLEILAILDKTTCVCRSQAANITNADLSTTDTYVTNRETARLQFGNVGGGAVIDLASIQIFKPGDIITLNTGEEFEVIDFSGNDELIVGNVNAISDLQTQEISDDDQITRVSCVSLHGDDSRQDSYDAVRRNVSIGATTSTFSYLEPLAFGIFNPYSDYGGPLVNSKNGRKIASSSWYNKQSDLIPYLSQLGITMTFKDIAANSMLYPYGRLNNPKMSDANDRVCRLQDVAITSAELVVFWVNPRKEKLLNLPKRVKIQSWTYDHREFDVPDLQGNETLNNDESTTSQQQNQLTNQQPTFIMYYGMVDKDSNNYSCVALNSSTNLDNDNQTVSLDVNSIEAGLRIADEAGLIVRSNTLGGDDIIDRAYSAKELYRFTLKNSNYDFPYSEVKFRGAVGEEAVFASYPSEFYFLIGEDDLNSFFVRKGQIQRSVVMNYDSTLIATDGASVNEDLVEFIGGSKKYNLHIFYIYDRYYIEIDECGNVTSSLDANYY